MRPWKTITSRYILKSPWISLVSEDVMLGNGKQLDAYYTLECPDFVHVFAVTAEGRCVLVRQYRHGVSGASLELPGGLLDQGETPIATARRELAEETGFVGGEATLVATLSPDAGKFRNRLHLVRITDVRPAARRPDEFEDIEVQLVTMQDLRAMALGLQIISAPQLALILLALEIEGRRAGTT